MCVYLNLIHLKLLFITFDAKMNRFPFGHLEHFRATSEKLWKTVPHSKLGEDGLPCHVIFQFFKTMKLFLKKPYLHFYVEVVSYITVSWLRPGVYVKEHNKLSDAAGRVCYVCAWSLVSPNYKLQSSNIGNIGNNGREDGHNVPQPFVLKLWPRGHLIIRNCF